MTDTMGNYEKAYAIYEAEGQDGVFKAVHDGTLQSEGWAWCEPCEIRSPVYDGACLVCGSEI